MLSVAEAQQIVLQHAKALPPEMRPLGPALLGLVLAEDVASDIDMPPYDKSLMDGYAVRAEDLTAGQATLHVIEEITAGSVPTKSLAKGQASRIMTGAPIPEGADAVVMVERTQAAGETEVRIEDSPRAGQNILRRGREMRRGETVLEAGSRLGPQEFGLLASVGKTAAKVHPAPQVAILPTGDEIVEPSAIPGPGQIRNSNGPMLAGQVARARGVPRLLGIARDNEESLRNLISEGLQSHVLILSGGVSAGTKDLVPAVLRDLGVEAHFHKVEMKPGKPVFFGTRGSTLVFGLPGNPVSSLVCFELFVRPALRLLQNAPEVLPPVFRARVTEDFHYRTDRPTYYPANLQWKEGEYQVQLPPWFGSPDLRALAKANGFALIDRGEHQIQAGQYMEVMAVEYF